MRLGRPNVKIGSAETLDTSGGVRHHGAMTDQTKKDARARLALETFLDLMAVSEEGPR